MTSLAQLGRLLAIDLGDRRVGLAISDPTGTIASPAGFLDRRPGKRPPLTALLAKAVEFEALGLGQVDAVNAGRASVRHLLHQGLIELYSRIGPLADEVALGMLQAEQALEIADAWVPPDGDGPATMIGATEAGSIAFLGSGPERPGTAK